MGRLKDISDTKLVFEAVAEAHRLLSMRSFTATWDAFLIGKDLPPVKNGYIIDKSLGSLLNDFNLQNAILIEALNGGVSVVLVQILVLDHYYRGNQPNVSTLRDAEQYFNNLQFRNIFSNRFERSMWIVYLENFVGKSWDNYAMHFDGDWTSIHLLDDSLPYCKVSLDAVFRYIIVAKSKNPNDLGIRMLGNHILLKFQMEPGLVDELSTRLDETMQHNALRELLPTFLRALVAEDMQLFLFHLKELPKQYDSTFPGEIYFALGAACPKVPTIVTAFKVKMDESLSKGHLSPALYLQAAGTQSLKTPDIIGLVERISESEDNDELSAAIQFLIQYVDTDYAESWFRSIATALFKRSRKEQNGLLEHLVYLLKDKNLELVYQGFSARFEDVKRDGMLNNAWDDIVEENPLMFQDYLTRWFKDGSTAVHRALLYLCHVHEIPAQAFRLSHDRLQSFTASERLYIAYKIAGYVYSKEHLANLLFSLTNCVRSDESQLLQNLHDLFLNYVIYNYRGTLDQIDQELSRTDLPPHLHHFHNSLKEEYERYFSELKKVRDFKEMRPIKELSEYINFYRQQQFSRQMNEHKRTGLSAFFKNTTVHSHKWAIRRPEQLVHDVQPLGHIQTSTEFPSGEKLNPVNQELMRRTYQKIQQDEININ